MQKKWYLSKTLIMNSLFIVATIFQNTFGYVISSETQLQILALINLILRLVTKEELTS